MSLSSRVPESFRVLGFFGYTEVLFIKQLNTYLAELDWPLDKITHFISNMQSSNLTEVQALYNSGEFTENRLLQIYKELYDVTPVNITDIGFRESATKSFGIQKCIDSRIVFCTYKREDYILVADPSDTFIRSLLQEAGLSKTPLAVAKKADVDKYIESWVQPLLISQLSGDIEVSSTEQAEMIDLAQSSNNAILKIITNLVTMAYQSGASDIQVIPSKLAADVYFRIDGKRVHRSALSTNSIPPLHRVLGSLAGQQTDDERKLLQGKIEFKVGDKPLEVRLNIIPTKLGSSINLRLHLQQEVSLTSLMTTPRMEKVFSSILKLSDGLVLFCGPTGSGKSTTMAAIARQLLSRQLNICSVEDPVELVCPGVNQVDVMPSKGLDYVSVAKSFLRHDPDVLIIGEIRDKDVANVAIQAADTGHLVLSTLHARDSISALSRLHALGIERTILADNLTAVISQRLVRKLCPFCYKSHRLTADDKHRKLFNIQASEEFEYHLAGGCTQCNGTGYQGRTIICECLVVSSEIHDAIERGASSLEIAALLDKQGYYRLLDDGIEKVRQGHTSFEELMPLLVTDQLKRGALFNEI